MDSTGQVISDAKLSAKELVRGRRCGRVYGLVEEEREEGEEERKRASSQPGARKYWKLDLIYFLDILILASICTS